MLSIHKAPRACQSCRRQLLNLFEHGFAAPTSRRNGLSSIRSNTRTIRSRDSRAFSTTITSRNQDAHSSEASANSEGKPLSDIKQARERELFVRQARQTFGETLPKDYLTIEEYALYERLYGPPLRETRGDDLELIEEEESPVEEQVRNVLMRENKYGDFEEVDVDPNSINHRDNTDSPLFDEDIEPLDFGESERYKDLESALGVNREDGKEIFERPYETQDVEPVEVPVRNQRELDVIARLQQEMEAAKAAAPEEIVEEHYEEEEAQEEEVIEENEEDFDPEDENDGYDTRTHENTLAGRWGTNPRTIYFPKDSFVQPVTDLLARTNPKHLADAAERAFGGPGLPYSAAVPASTKTMPQKHIGLEAGQHRMTEIEADAFMAAVLPATYASVASVLVETRKRLGTSWLRDLIFREGGEGPRVLDAGGAGVGVMAWREMLHAEWDVLKSDGIVEGEDVPYGSSTVLTGSSTLRHRISRFLDNTTFLPRLPDYLHASNSEKMLDGSAAQGRKTFDVIIAPHTLFPLKEDYRRKSQVQNLWTLLEPNGGVLILIEKGLPRGFEAIAGARALLLNNHIESPGDTPVEQELQAPGTGERFKKKEPGMIIAPCTNHAQCPMYKIEGTSIGRKDFCHFPQRFIRPPFLQKLIGAKVRNHEDAKFSYIAIRRGVDNRRAEVNGIQDVQQGEAATLAALAGYEPDINDQENSSAATDTTISTGTPQFSTLNLPRAILSPLKRRGHVTLDLCTPSATIERWTVPRSFSDQAYRDARKSAWGDLWALGAKTRVQRNIRLGREFAAEDGKKMGIKTKGGKMGGSKRQGEGDGKSRKKKGKDVYEFEVGEKGYEGVRKLSEGRVDRGKRTKGGRREGRQRRLDIGDDNDDDDDMF